MNMFGLNVPVKNLPVLDQTFMPLSAFVRAFEKSAKGGKEL